MSLYFRFILLVLKLMFKSYKVDLTKPLIRQFRVLPTDVDINKHLSNAKYSSICDLMQAEQYYKSEFSATLKNEVVMPYFKEKYFKFYKPIHFMERYTVTARYLGVKGYNFYVEKVFSKGDVICAIILVKGRVYVKGMGNVDVKEFYKGRIDQNILDRELPDYAEKIIEDEHGV